MTSVFLFLVRYKHTSGEARYLGGAYVSVKKCGQFLRGFKTLLKLTALYIPIQTVCILSIKQRWYL